MGQNIEKVQHVYINNDQQIHEGGFGTIYEGYDTRLQKMVALKKIQKNENFHREEEILHTITKHKHENIMKFYGSVTSEKGDIYLILELCQGGTLRDYIDKGISEWEVLRIFSQIVSAMVFLHKKEIIHRDLKPENILLDFNMNVKIADFGTARESATYMTVNAGTYGYRAPQIGESWFNEKVDKKKYKPKCDVWSVGMILYEMLAGELVDNEKGKSKFEKINLVLDESLSYWKKFLNQMLVVDEERRSSFEKLQKQLNKCKTQMQEDMLKKLGYKCESLEHGENKRNFQNEEHANCEDLRFERSVETLRLSTLYLHFKKDKDIFFLSIIKDFQEGNQSFPLPQLHQNVIKVIAMSLICKKKQEMLSMIKDERLEIPYGEINMNSFAEGDQIQFQNLLETHKTYLEQDLVYWGQRARESLPKLRISVDKYRKSEGGGDADVLANVVKVLERPVREISLAEFDEMFSNICRCQEVNRELQKSMKLQDLRSFGLLLLFKNLDKEIPDKLFEQENIVMKKRKELLEMGSSALRQYIKKLKSG